MEVVSHYKNYIINQGALQVKEESIVNKSTWHMNTIFTSQRKSKTKHSLAVSVGLWFVYSFTMFINSSEVANCCASYARIASKGCSLSFVNKNSNALFTLLSSMICL